MSWSTLGWIALGWLMLSVLLGLAFGSRLFGVEPRERKRRD